MCLAAKLGLRTCFPKEIFLYMVVGFYELFAFKQQRPILHLFIDSLDHLFSKFLKSTTSQVLYEVLETQIATLD